MHMTVPDQMAFEMGRGHFNSPAHTSGMFDMEMPTRDGEQVAPAPASSRVTGQPLTPDDSGLQSAFGKSSTFDFMNKVVVT
jgi:hypothetical protein